MHSEIVSSTELVRLPSEFLVPTHLPVRSEMVLQAMQTFRDVKIAFHYPRKSDVYERRRSQEEPRPGRRQEWRLKLPSCRLQRRQ